MPHARALALVSGLFAVAGALPIGQVGPPGWVAEVGDLLERRARAVVQGDEAAFRDTMSAALPAFKRAKLVSFRRLRELPLESYQLRLDTETYLNLDSGIRGPARGEEVHLVVVEERIQLRGFDEEPTTEAMFLTVARRGDRWSVVDDDDIDDLGLLSPRYVWDFAAVEQVRGRDVLVLTQGSRSTARRIARETDRAAAFVRERWPLGWEGKAIAMIPRSSDELSRVLQTRFDLGPFVAFAASSVDRTRGRYRLVGHRVYVQPSTFFDNPESYQADTLSHELLHVATRPDAGAFTPAWLDEGVAQIFGERARPPLDALAAQVRAGRFDGEVPEDWEFTLSEPDDIRAAYAASADIVDQMRDRFGARAVGRFYDLLGSESPVSFGTPRYHLDRAARRAFGRSFSSIESRWARSVNRRF